MDLNTIIQVALGMIFVWVVLAVITSQVQEWISSLLKWRATMLEDTIVTMLSDPNLKDKIYEHPLIQGLHTNNGTRKPGALPADKFALVLLEKVLDPENIKGLKAAEQEAKTTFEQLKRNIEALKNIDENGNDERKHLKQFAESLDTLLIGVEDKAEDATHAITEARKRVEGWFDNSMDRLGGAYRRRTQIVGIIVGVLVAAILNADSNAIVTALWKDPILRQAVVAQVNQMQAQGSVSVNPTPAPTTQPTDASGNEEPPQPPDIQQIIDTANDLNITSLPIGWSKKTLPDDPAGWIGKILGILLSGMAAAQGAPYWFDLMRKLVTRNPPVPPEPA